MDPYVDHVRAIYLSVAPCSLARARAHDTVARLRKERLPRARERVPATRLLGEWNAPGFTHFPLRLWYMYTRHALFAYLLLVSTISRALPTVETLSRHNKSTESNDGFKRRIPACAHKPRPQSRSSVDPQRRVPRRVGGSTPIQSACKLVAIRDLVFSPRAIADSAMG